MIKYALICADDDHEFEAWFQSSQAYEVQVANLQVTCPRCGSHRVTKAIMAPAVATRSRSERAEAPLPADGDRRMQHLRQIRDAVHAKAEYVGGRFAEEARRIHFDESPARGIYGEASADEARGLAEDGIPFLPMPRLPEDMN